MGKKRLFPFRLSDGFRENIKKAAEKLDMTMTEFIRQAIIEKLRRGD